jgi:cell division protein FtsQ
MLIAVMVALLIVTALLVSKFFVIETILITGNDYYTEDEIKEMILPSNFKNNTLLVWLRYKIGKTKDLPFIEKYQIQMVSPSKLEIIVYEKNIIGYVEYMGSNMYFDRDGMIIESSTTVREDIPQVVGVYVSKLVLHEKMETNQNDLFTSVMTMGQLFQKYQLELSKIYYDKEGNISVVFGDIKVVLGDGSSLEGKVAELNDILPQLSGLKGTLYLNTYTEDSTRANYIFKKNENK